ncbi:hypothetical protein BJF96_g9321, partial [Verticillium dahliae]
MAAPQRPTPDVEELRRFYVGKLITELPMPAAVLDVSSLKRHCKTMLDAVDSLGVGFRAHVKTHKTIEAARLQIGETSKDVNIVVSTLLNSNTCCRFSRSAETKAAMSTPLRHPAPTIA